MTSQVTNIVIAGLGGQGVLKASDILAAVVLREGYDVKKSEVHGMSQRGGSVCSDVRYGPQVLSPMVPPGEADYLVVLAEDQVDNNRWQLKPGGMLIEPRQVPAQSLPNRKCLNIALLGCLSQYLNLPEASWHAAIRGQLNALLQEMNLKAFALGRSLMSSGQPGKENLGPTISGNSIRIPPMAGRDC
jgi:indolepyruvate ferredoxin oxidoreductase, beta subunit